MKNNTAIILLLLSVGLFYTVTRVQYQEVVELGALADEYRNVLQNVSGVIELRDRLLVTYETLPAADIDRLNKILPDNIDLVRLALDLDGMASRYDISIKNIQATTGADGEARSIVLPEHGNIYETAEVSFGFVSNYENFMRLLADLESNLRIMDIKSVSFQTGESNLYDYKISVETYWLK